jgi:hypothetical protein
MGVQLGRLLDGEGVLVVIGIDDTAARLHLAPVIPTRK